MTEVSSQPAEACACAPFPGPVEGDLCKACSPNMTVTCEEVDILAHMREIKNEARAVHEQLKGVRKTMEKTMAHVPGSEGNAEFDELAKQLHDLKHNWKEWVHRLDAAIEHKMVLLGHREARGE